MTSQVPCADFGTNDEKLVDYLSKHKLAILGANSFIDHDEVDPFKGPVKYTEALTDVYDGVLLLKEPGVKSINSRGFSNVEHRVSLQDSLYQFPFFDPVEFSYLTVEKDFVGSEFHGDVGDTFYECRFDMSSTILVEKRQVVSFLQLFGDLGGLSEAFATMVFYLIGRY